MILLEDKNREYKRYRPSPYEKLTLANNGLQWVLSSNVSAVGVIENDLIVRFHNGSMYRYLGKAELYDSMLNSNSKGHFVWERLRKPKVPYEKIGSLPLPNDKKLTDEQVMGLIETQGLATEARLIAMGLFIPQETLNIGLTTF